MKPWTLIVLVVATSGCSVLVDDAIRDPVDAGGIDAPAVVDCTGAPDGMPCGGNRICVDGTCSLTRCGDGVVDVASEECDDGNDVPRDGCEDGCFFSCNENADCDDGVECTGEETCGGDHACVAGTSLANGTACTRAEGDPGVCRESECVAAGCGNGLVDATEECDDDNDVDGDGCDGDCTFSCETDAECDDASVCTGTESCDLAAHTCIAGTAMACDDGSPCTSNECDAMTGCVYPLIDADADGHASQELGACGDDCNDMRDDVSPSAVELCGDALDSDCDGNPNPASTPVWYRDCDDDSYAAIGAVTMTACAEPPGTSGCLAWTTRVPISGNRSTFDCNDGNRNVRPNQTAYSPTPISGASSSVDFDYNCDVVEARRYTATGVSSTGSCVPFLFGCSGASGWTGTTVPACGVAASASLCVPTRDGDSCMRVRDSSYEQPCR